MPRYTVRFGDAIGEAVEARNYTVVGLGDEEWTVFFGDDGREVARFSRIESAGSSMNQPPEVHRSDSSRHRPTPQRPPLGARGTAPET
jgi:hypothetical protein